MTIYDPIIELTPQKVPPRVRALANGGAGFAFCLMAPVESPPLTTLPSS